MRLEVGALRIVCLSLFCMVYAGFAVFLLTVPARLIGADSVPVIQVVLTYLLCALGFAAFPKARRIDLAKFCLLSIIVLSLARGALEKEVETYRIAWTFLGILAVLLPSFLEGFRAALRLDPYEPISVLFSGGRRRSGSKERQDVQAAAKAEGDAPVKRTQHLRLPHFPIAQ